MTPSYAAVIVGVFLVIINCVFFHQFFRFFFLKAIHTHVKVIEHENREKKRASKHTTKIIL